MNLAHELNRIQSGYSSIHHWSDAFSSLFVLWAHSFCLTIFVQFLITQNFNQQVSITGFTTRFVLRKYHWQKIIRLHSLYRIPPSQLIMVISNSVSQDSHHPLQHLVALESQNCRPSLELWSFLVQENKYWSNWSVDHFKLATHPCINRQAWCKWFDNVQFIPTNKKANKINGFGLNWYLIGVQSYTTWFWRHATNIGNQQ